MKTELDTLLKEIEARAEKATPGEWKLEHDGYITAGDVDILDEGCGCCGRLSNLDNDTNNFEFIAHARMDVPRVVKALRYVFEDLFPPLYKMTEEEHKQLLAILKGTPNAVKD